MENKLPKNPLFFKSRKEKIKDAVKGLIFLVIFYYIIYILISLIIHSQAFFCWVTNYWGGGCN